MPDPSHRPREVAAPLRWWTLPPASGAIQLARDDATLEDASPASLRFYRMDPPTLSLGRFQDAAAAPALPAGSELARRSTGGGAIYHHARSIVVALTVDSEAFPDARNPLRWYARTNRVLVAALAALGVRAHERGRPPAPPTAADDAQSPAEPYLCFDRRERTDLVVARGADVAKIAGCAQRRTARRVLLHGAISLAPGELARGAISLSEAAGREIGEAELVRAVGSAFAADGWALEEDR